jgi:hypothetical protein
MSFADQFLDDMTRCGMTASGTILLGAPLIEYRSVLETMIANLSACHRDRLGDNCNHSKAFLDLHISPMKQLVLPDL